MSDSAGPYAQSAELYWRLGWRGVLPLPYGTKTPPPHGYTGADGRDPSMADVLSWADGPEGAGNIALRLPPGVIGLDVDAYGSKAGAATFLAAHGKWGQLPATVRTTSRGDGVSGIYLFRVPVDLVRWPGELGPGVEIIQYRHRYAVCEPSMHPSGSPYQWLRGPDNMLAPSIASLPELPEQWIAGLQAEVGRDPVRSDASGHEVATWVRSTFGDRMCHAVASALGNAQQQLSASTRSRHDTAVNFAAGIARMGGEGHRGANLALDQLGSLFANLVVADGTRSQAAADAEWMRLEDGAIRLAMHEHPEPEAADPCDDPFAGLIEDRPRTALPASPPTATTAPAGPLAQQPMPAHEPTAEQIDASRVADGLPPIYGEPWTSADALLMGGDMAIVPPSPPVLSNMLHDQGVEGGDRPAGDLARVHPGAMPAGPQGILSPEQQQIEAMRQAAANQDYERQLAQRTARRMLEDAEAARMWREPVWAHDTAAELALPDSPQPYVIADLLPENGNVLLAAQFKAGKTTLMLNLLRSLTEGSPFLGRHPVATPRRVGYWNYEVSREQFRLWLRDIGPAAPQMSVPLTLRGYILPLTTKHGADWAVRWLETNGIATWVLDPFARAFTGQNENDNTEVARFLEALDEIKSRAGVRELVMPAHTGRAAHEQGAERVRGATRLDDWTDVRWMLTVDSTGGRYFRATGRDVETADLELQYDNASRRLTLTDNVRDAKGKLDAGKMAGKNVAILNIVTEMPGITARGVRTELKVRGITNTNGDETEVLKLLDARGMVHSRPLANGTGYFPGDGLTS